MNNQLPAGSETYSEAIESASNYTQWLLDLFDQKIRGDILEVGIGHGGYVPYLMKHGRYLGVDISPESIAVERRKYPDAEFQTADITSSDFVKEYGASFDTVVCLNVLEHIEDDYSALRNLYEVLRPDGRLLVVVPAVATLYNDLDKLAGHFRRYSRTVLRDRISRTDFRIEKLQYFNPIGGLGWYVNKFRRYDSLNDGAVNTQIALFDKYLVPLSRAASAPFSRIFGQSIVLVAKKESS